MLMPLNAFQESIQLSCKLRVIMQNNRIANTTKILLRNEPIMQNKNQKMYSKPHPSDIMENIF